MPDVLGQDWIDAVQRRIDRRDREMPSVSRALNQLVRLERERRTTMTVDQAITTITRDRSFGAASVTWSTDYVFCDEDGNLKYYVAHSQEADEVIMDYTLNPDRQGNEWRLVRRTDKYVPQPLPPERINTGHPRQIMVRRENQICEE